MLLRALLNGNIRTNASSEKSIQPEAACSNLPVKMKSSETSEFLETTDDRTEPWMSDSIISSFILPMRFSGFSHIDNASVERAWQLSRFPKSLYMGSGFVREVDVERGRECGMTR